MQDSFLLSSIWGFRFKEHVFNSLMLVRFFHNGDLEQRSFFGR